MDRRSLQRLKQIAKPDSFDDQKTPVEISNSENSAINFADIQSAIFSQLKRIINGDNPGNWYDDPTQINLGDIRYLLYKQDVACLSTDSVGDWLCTRGDRINEKWRVQKADPFDINKMPAIGVLISKTTPTVGTMQVIGPCKEIFSDLDCSKPVAWLGSTGIQYSLPDVGNNEFVMIQRLGKAMAKDIFWVSGSLEMIKRVK
jgi:hypothetical protein